MTIEKSIDNLTAAIQANTAAILANAKPSPIIGADQKVIDSAPLLNKAPPADAAVTMPPTQPEQPTALEYKAVQVPFLKLVAKNKDAALATLKQPPAFDYPNLKVAKPEHYAAILAAVNVALAS